MASSKAKTQSSLATKAKPTNKGKKATAKAAKVTKREVVYDKLYAEIFDVSTPLGPITEDKAKELLGWQEETDKEKAPFGNKHVTEISKIYGVKVRATNNTINRFLDLGKVALLKQEILRQRWQFNGEPIIIGTTGQVLNGQHALYALILAVKEYRDATLSYPEWETEPTIGKAVMYGVSEEDRVVDTMDTCKARSLTEVIGRANYFRDMKEGERKTASKMCDWAIRAMWKRTGVHITSLGIKQTHAECIAYLESHSQLLKAVKHIFNENDANKLAHFLPLGMASAMMYLMGCSNTDPDTYYKADEPTDKLLDWSNWDKASEFWVELVAGSAKLKPVRDVLTELIKQSPEGKVPNTYRWAVLTKAWNLYSAGKAITSKVISLKIELKDDVPHLAEEPLLGGIDVGNDGVDHETTNDVTPVAITNGTAKAREKKFGKAKNGTKAGEDWAKGDTAWVHTKGQDSYFCKLNIDPYETEGDGSVKVMVDAADGEWEVNVADLSLKEFEKVS